MVEYRSSPFSESWLNPKPMELGWRMTQHVLNGSRNNWRSRHASERVVERCNQVRILVFALWLLAICGCGSTESAVGTGDSIESEDALVPNDLDATYRWLSKICAPYHEAYRNINDLARANAFAKIREEWAEVPQGIPIRWDVRVLAVRHDDIDFLTKDLGDRRYAGVSLSLRTFSGGRDERRFSGKLEVGTSIDFGHASTLKSGDVITITGELYCQDKLLLLDDTVIFDADVTNTRVVR